MELILLLLLGILLFPFIAVTLFMIALITYLKTPKEEVEKRKTRRSSLITWSIVLGIGLALLAALIVYFATAVSFM